MQPVPIRFRRDKHITWTNLMQTERKEERTNDEKMNTNNSSRITTLEADITTLKLDAIVNAANETLLGGGGVDGAIHSAAGPELLESCKKIGGCLTGEARITPGFRLLSRFVIHTVGPVWHGGNDREPELLASCYRNSLALARQHQVRSIGFPSISTWVYRYPKNEAARIAVRVVKHFLENDSELETVQFICFSKTDREIYQEILEQVF